MDEYVNACLSARWRKHRGNMTCWWSSSAKTRTTTGVWWASTHKHAEKILSHLTHMQTEFTCLVLDSICHTNPHYPLHAKMFMFQRDFKERIQQQRSTQNRLKEQRQQIARAKKYHNDYHVQHRARLMRARTKEERVGGEGHSCLCIPGLGLRPRLTVTLFIFSSFSSVNLWMSENVEKLHKNHIFPELNVTSTNCLFCLKM